MTKREEALFKLNLPKNISNTQLGILLAEQINQMFKLAEICNISMPMEMSEIGYDDFTESFFIIQK